MGFSEIFSTLIMFIAVVTISSSLIIMFRGQVADTQSQVIEQQKIISNQIRSNINIDMVYFNNVTETVHVFVRNTGNIQIDNDTLDVYIDSMRVPRNSSNRTIQVLSDTELKNTGYWDPKEQVEIKIFYNVTRSESHVLYINTEYGANSEYEFSA